MLDETLIARAVVEEERGDCARRRVTRGEVRVYECGRRAVRVRHGHHVAIWTGRRLRTNIGNDEVAVHAADLPRVHRAWRASVGEITSTWTFRWCPYNG